jgi:hypothetical protein
VPDRDDDARAELLREFNAAISGMDLADLGRLADDLMRRGRQFAPRPPRPDLRRPRLSEESILRVRVDLDRAKPPIWRRLDLRSDLTLDVVHHVLQAAFGWTDSHLHRFALGGDPFDSKSQWFLCPYDVEEGDDDGIPEEDVRLDETLHEPGDALAYVYDYGDSWDLTIRLESVLPATADAPPAKVVDGRRAAPPEDSGGITDAESLAEVLDDSAHFDADFVNAELRSLDLVLAAHGVDRRLSALAERLRFQRFDDDLDARIHVIGSGSTRPSDDELEDALRPYTWFLDRAKDDGIELTSAGYLKPADVVALGQLLPSVQRRIGKKNRESDTWPVLRFREWMQDLTLLRKYKGRLLLTRRAKSLHGDSRRLWDWLAAALIPPDGGFDTDATLLLLAYAATSEGGALQLERVADALNHLGWRYAGDTEVDTLDLYQLPAYAILLEMCEPQTGARPAKVSRAAAALARAALCR